MGMFDFIRNEPINETNTRDEIQKLNEVAQNAAINGNQLMADAAHAQINNELDRLEALHNQQ